MKKQDALVVLEKELKQKLKANPYPLDIFLKLNEADYRKIHSALKEIGYTSAGLHGNWGNRLWRDHHEDILKRVRELKKQ